MTRDGSRIPEVALALLTLAAACGAVFVLAVLWAADFDPNTESASSAAAGSSGLLLALGVVVALVAAVVRRSWRTLTLVLLCSAVVALLPWAQLL